MKNYRLTWIICAVFFLQIGCEPSHEKKKNFNIIITSDLSNRINESIHKNKILPDVDLIAYILENYYDEESAEDGVIGNDLFHSNGRLIGQRDKISMRFPNATNIKTYAIQTEKLKIDLSDDYFDNSSAKRIQYLQNKDTVRSFRSDKQEFLKEIKRVYTKAKEKTYGADIYNLFNNRLNNIIVNDTIEPYRNILVLFTDGYIESGLNYKFSKKGNKTINLNKQTIDDFRKAYENSGEADVTEFFNKNQYGIVPIKNELLQNLEVLAIEFYDRSINEGGNPTEELYDYEILKLFWEDWLIKSGVKRFEIHDCFDSLDEFKEVWKNFILAK